MHTLSEGIRATIRKIISIVAIRNEYRRPENASGIAHRKARKALSPYTGATSLFALTEGNPRWFIGLFGALLDRMRDDQKVDRPAQAKEVEATIFRYLAMLKTIRADARLIPQAKRNRGLLGLMDLIGTYFFQEAVLADFKADIHTSFTLDANADDDLVRCIGTAVNVGAVVVEQDESNIDYSNLRNHRFRLTYLLAPHYKIPPVLMKSISLHAILRFSGEEIYSDYLDEDQRAREYFQTSFLEGP